MVFSDLKNHIPKLFKLALIHYELEVMGKVDMINTEPENLITAYQERTLMYGARENILKDTNMKKIYILDCFDDLDLLIRQFALNSAEGQAPENLRNFLNVFGSFSIDKVFFVQHPALLAEIKNPHSRWYGNTAEPTL